MSAEPSGPADIDATVADLLAVRDATVLVVGDALLDVYVSGSVDRISPEAPVPVLRERARRAVLGGSANVAANVVALGGRAILLSRVGADPEGSQLLALAHDQGIDVQGVVTSASVPTPRKERLVASGQQLARIDREVCVALESAERDVLRGAWRAFLAQPGARSVVLADYAKGVLDDGLLRELITDARAAGVPVVADPKTTDLRRYAGATVLKPNRREAQAAVGADVPREELLQRVLAASGADNVVMSLAEDGALVAGRDVGETMRLPAHALQVADVSGAGDTMVATLSVALAAGVPLLRAAELANIAASRVCEKAGTSTIGFAELLEAHRAAVHGVRHEKWLDRGTAAVVADRMRSEGRRLVFANGCFDVLHAGHVSLLRRARDLGDGLLVAINSDESVRRLKGPGRPAVELDDRVAVLSALASIDFVVVFGEETPLDLIRAVRPDVLVKGGDYRAEDVVGSADVATWGGEVVIVPLLEGRSTTALLSARSSSPG